MPRGPASVQQRFAALAQALAGEPGVTLGSARKGFGSEALQVDGKIFAMVPASGQLVLKLPRPRVDALVTAGAGARFEMGNGRILKEWIAFDAEAELDWLALAREALAFVRG